MAIPPFSSAESISDNEGRRLTITNGKHPSLYYHLARPAARIRHSPVEAIFHEGNVPSPWSHFVELNAVRVSELKLAGGKLTEKKEAKMGAGCRGR
jgi:hypothetical protein